MLVSVDIFVSNVESVLNMFILVVSVLLAASASAAPGYLDGYHAPALLPAPTIIKTALPAPVLAPAPIFDHAPIFAPAPTIIKAAAPVIAAPVVKAVAPATSYATVTQVHVSHPQTILKVAQPILKTVVAPQPIIAQPILKSYDIQAPWASANPWAGGWH